MRAIGLMLLLLAGGSVPAGAVPPPEAVAILYNSAVPESRQLAEIYAKARSIPADNLIALDLPKSPDISRDDYNKLIVKPLRAEFERREWWKRGTTPEGITLPVANRICVLVTMRGVPLRILPTPKPPTPPPAPGAKPPKPKTPQEIAQETVNSRDEAAVDSELAMFGVDGVPIAGTLQNKFYQSTKPITGPDFPFLILTARIDAPTFATCQRMIRDAVETEKSGLWGMAYVDIANKYPLGDQWLEDVIKANLKTGIPTVVDRFNDTLPLNYPMSDAAFYYGWYDANISGPFLNPRFQFRKGAVAMHLHSFSAEQLTSPNRNWSGPLLERGAAVTVGNVFEPYLEATHNFAIIHQSLLDGDCWVEACWKAMPYTSWQSVVLGDPLYQPFKHLDGTGEVTKADNDYRAVRAAMLRWPDDPAERAKQLDKAAARLKSGVLAEAAGLDMLERGLTADAAQHFRTAKGYDIRTEDKLRQDFHLIAIDRKANHKDLAIRGLRDAQLRYGPIPEADALKGWLDILDPPPPPPARPPTPATPKKP